MEKILKKGMISTLKFLGGEIKDNNKIFKKEMKRKYEEIVI